MPGPGPIHEDELLGKAYDHRLMRRLLGYLRPYRKRMILALVLLLTLGAIELAPPYLTKLAIDRYIVPGDLSGMPLVLGLFLGSLIAAFVLRYTQNRIMQRSGQDYYCYAPEPCLFEPLFELGADVDAGAAAGAIHPHDTPWREPAITRFSRAGTVVCKRVPGRVERGDCLYHLVTELVR